MGEGDKGHRTKGTNRTKGTKRSRTEEEGVEGLTRRKMRRTGGAKDTKDEGD